MGKYDGKFVNMILTVFMMMFSLFPDNVPDYEERKRVFSSSDAPKITKQPSKRHSAFQKGKKHIFATDCESGGQMVKMLTQL